MTPLLFIFCLFFVAVVFAGPVGAPYGLRIDYGISFTNANVGFSNSLYMQFQGKTNTSTQWQLFGGPQDASQSLVRNTNCWLYPVDVSGQWTGGNPPSAQMSLITARHAITAHHLGSEHAGDTLHFRGRDGVLYPGLIARRDNVRDDIDLITFTQDFPEVVQPFLVLTTNCLDYLRPYTLHVCWYIWNSGHVNVGSVSYVGRDIGMVAPIGCPFYECCGNSGDSAGPMWLLYRDRLVLVCTLQAQGIIGPFISHPMNWSAIKPFLGSNHVDYLDLANHL